MPWNPFRAIGDAIGRVFSRGEQTPAPAPAPAPSAAPERKGGLAGLWDRVTGGERRSQRQSERQPKSETRERQAPSVQAPSASAPSAQERELPKFSTTYTADYQSRDERAFGADNDIAREFQSAVDDFIADRGGLAGLNVDTREWLQHPTISEPFSNYWQSGGFTADQVLAGMTTISNIRIVEGEDGDIDVEFDYEAEVDGYEVHGHAS